MEMIKLLIFIKKAACNIHALIAVEVSLHYHAGRSAPPAICWGC